MSKFSIEFTGHSDADEGEVASGVLTIGNHKEAFQSPLSYWNVEKYLSQWKEGLMRLINGNAKSAIVTSMLDPKTANFIFWWVLYIDGDNIHIQNHILFMSDIDKGFDEKKIYNHIPDRETSTDEGEAISEWHITVADIAEFLPALAQANETGSDYVG